MLKQSLGFSDGENFIDIEPGTVVVELSPGVRLVGGRILRAGCELKDVFTVEKMLASEWAVEL